MTTTIERPPLFDASRLNEMRAQRSAAKQQATPTPQAPAPEKPTTLVPNLMERLEARRARQAQSRDEGGRGKQEQGVDRPDLAPGAGMFFGAKRSGPSR